MDPSLIQQIPEVIISPKGIFKYILIQIIINGDIVGMLVRGSIKYNYHADNFKAFKSELAQYGFKNIEKKGNKITAEKGNQKVEFVCPGGGRIEHNYNGKKCSIYGYSKTFGYVDHKIAKKLIMKNLGYKEDEIVLNEKEY